MPLFDIYIAIDWSARGKPSPRKPSKDSIWIAEHPKPKNTPAEVYCRTRHECLTYLRERLGDHINASRRVFVGFDFAFGFPEGFAKAIGLDGTLPPWRQVWDELARLVVDNPDNSNNRFEVAAELNRRCGGDGPFWGCFSKLDNLKPTSPQYPYTTHSNFSLERLRCVDRRESGVQPVWKLAYAGSVGSQTILGIPVVRWLRDEFADCAVWPFETGFTTEPTPANGPFILLVEIWPTIVAIDPSVPIKDQAQVRAVAWWLAELDMKGELGRLFDVPQNLPPEAVSACLREECWIFGVGD